MHRTSHQGNAIATRITLRVARATNSHHLYGDHYLHWNNTKPLIRIYIIDINNDIRSIYIIYICLHIFTGDIPSTATKSKTSSLCLSSRLSLHFAPTRPGGGGGGGGTPCYTPTPASSPCLASLYGGTGRRRWWLTERDRASPSPRPCLGAGLGSVAVLASGLCSEGVMLLWTENKLSEEGGGPARVNPLASEKKSTSSLAS